MSVEDFITQTTAQVEPLEAAYSLAAWEAAVTGTEAANRREQETQAAVMRGWGNPDLHAEAKSLHEAGIDDGLLARLVKVIHLESAKYLQDEATIERLTELEAAVRQEYYNFRARVDGREVSDNELDAILQHSADPEEVRRAWEASKQVGARVAESVRELARVRNTAARAQGYRDHFQRALTVEEIDEGYLLELFSELEAAARGPFEALKAELDHRRAAHFGLDIADLRPWHYGDRFFQEAPPLNEVDFDAPFAELDPTELSRQTYDGLGLEVRDILQRSDLYEREGKNQHAFCIDIDRKGDIRTLNNLRPNHRWNETLLHELGHAVYDKYIDADLPWLIRKPPHTLSTEAIAILMGSLTFDRDWLMGVLNLPEVEAARFVEAGRAQHRAGSLIFTQWVLVMVNFERALYADPEQDLNTLWWDLVEQFQRLRRPEGRDAPDWAAKYHVALAPVYYHNYELGHLLQAQIKARLHGEIGGIVDRPEAGAWLTERVFEPGARRDWAGHAEAATGEALNPRYFVDSLS